jgi:hypothetical protein
MRTAVALTGVLAVTVLALVTRFSDIRSSGAIKPQNAAVAGTTARLYDFTPLVFEANQGQTDGEVCFIARGQGFTLFLTRKEMVLVPTQPGGRSERIDDLLHYNSPEFETDRKAPPEAPLRLRFVGANDVSPRGIQELPGKSNYFIGNRSVLGVRQYARVLYKNLYPGIDLVFYGNHGELEYDFVVAPGATPADIRLEPSKPVEAAADGTLFIGSLRKERPVAFQQIGARREGVPAQYAVAAKRISFALGPYDHSLPLVVDPRIVTSRYFGGSKGDHTNDAAVDSSGNIYITGYTSSTDFPLKNAFQKKWAGVVDGFVTKLSPAGNIIYSTYLGGSSDEYPKAIAVDGAGHAYVVWLSGSTDFPVKNPLFPTPQDGDFISGAFVTKLSPSGSALVYSTFLSSKCVATGVAVRNGCAYIVGATLVPLPAVVNAIQSQQAGGAEAFVMQLNPLGTAVLFSTYLGGSAGDSAHYVDMDPLGGLYVAGSTTSSDFPVTAGAFQTKLAGTCRGKNCGRDVFVTKINVDMRKIVYSTYVGGKGYEIPYSIAVDRLGNAYVTGLTDSGNFPAVNAVLHRKPGLNAYVTKLNASGSGLVYSTYWGSGVGEDIAVDYYGNAYVTGGNDYCTLPVLNPLPNSPTCSPGFISKLAPDGSILYSSYLSLGFGFALAMGPSGTIYLAGEDFGANDAYVARITRN